MTVDVAAWIDGSQPTDAEVDAWADQIAGAGINTAILSLNVGVGDVWIPRWKPAKLARCTDALRARGLSVQWMPWLKATKEAIDQQIEALAGLFAHSSPDQISPDAEGHTKWHGWGEEGVDLAPYFAESLARLKGCPEAFGVTAIPPFNGPRKQDLALMFALAEYGPVEGQPQGYSQYQPNKTWTHNPVFRPGPIQKHVLGSWWVTHDDGRTLPIAPLTSIRYGQMGFCQAHPTGPRGVAALELAHATVAESGLVSKVSYWAWKGMKSSPRTIGFLRRISGSAGYKFEDTGTMHEGVLELQRLLLKAGYNPGELDGKLGPLTIGNATAYRNDARFFPDELANVELLELIDTHIGSVPSPWETTT